MNEKINKNNFDKLIDFELNRYIFGSRLHRSHNENSDYDYVIILDDSLYDKFNTKAKYLPNIHSYQFDDTENNTQYVLMTETQFYRNFFSGDGNMLADIVLLNKSHPDYKNRLFLTRTYKIIKAYLGVAKRDLRLHRNIKKKRFHALRSLYMAEKLINNEYPCIREIKYMSDFREKTDINADELDKKQDSLRSTLNKMLDKNEITLYPGFEEKDEEIQIMVSCNNKKQFKY